MEVYADGGATMAALGEVAVWSFELAHWGECTQASKESVALRKFARRVGVNDLRVVERIGGRAQVFTPDLAPATDDQVHPTLRVLAEQRAQAIQVLESTPR